MLSSRYLQLLKNIAENNPETVSIRGFDLTEEAIAALIPVLQANHNLTRIDLGTSSIIDKENFDKLLCILQNKKIISFQLDRGLINFKCLQSAINYLDSITTIENLDISYTYLSIDQLKQLLNGLQRQNNLHCLNLSGVRIDVEKAKIIASFIENNQSLTKLCLASTLLQSEQVKILSEAIKNNHFLKIIDLYDNQLRWDKDCLDFMEMIKKHPTLEDVNLSRNRLNADGCREFISMLEHNHHLLYFNLKANPIKVKNQEDKKIWENKMHEYLARNNSHL